MNIIKDSNKPFYLDTTQPLNKRIEDLVSRMICQEGYSENNLNIVKGNIEVYGETRIIN